MTSTKPVTHEQIISMRIYIILFSLGLFLFQHGFFSSRKQLENISIIPDNPIPATHQRIFLFIIDALRIDFVTNDTFPFLHSLLSSSPTQSKLFTFRADPPTITSQRIKALTTGSFPTFIDFASNFNAASVQDDTWLNQLIRSPRHNNTERVFMGDDTWISLYPHAFSANRSYPMESFNTRDLDTVDEGIERTLLPYLKQCKASRSASSNTSCAPWSLIIAHFLGVDHIGHTYHSQHPLMHSRLQHMDALLKTIISLLPPDTLLLLFGDHGMTNDGNHGGSTREETDAALFAFSTREVFPPLNIEWNDTQGEFGSLDNEMPPNNDPRVVTQIDIVPTISLLLGLPIPFSNLGALIPEFFYTQFVADGGAALVSANLAQINGYLDVMGMDNTVDTGRGRVEDGGRGWRGEVWAELQRVKVLGKKMWASFNLPLMVGGVLIMTACCAMAILSAFTAAHITSTPSTLFTSTSTSTPPYLPPLFITAHSLSLLSNSCILHEHWIVYSLTMALIVSTACRRYERYRGVWGMAAQLLLIRFCLSPHGPVWSTNATHDRQSEAYEFMCHSLVAALHLIAITITARALHAGTHFPASSIASHTASHQAASHLVSTPRLLGFFGCLLSRYLHPIRNLMLNRFVVCVAIADVAVMALRVWFLSSTSTSTSTSYSTSGSTSTEHSMIRRSSIVPLLDSAIYTVCILLLLTTPGHSTVFSAAVIVIACYLPIPHANSPNPHSMLPIALVLFSRTLFFCTNHRLDFGALHLSAGFTTSDTFQFVPAGFFLAINTLGYDLFACLASMRIEMCQADSPGTCGDTGDGARNKNDTQMPSPTQTFVCSKLLIVAFSCLCVLIQRDHLMLYDVFAPKLCFEVAFWVPICAALFVWGQGRARGSADCKGQC